MKPSINEINDVLDKCIESLEEGSSYPGMSYEQGIEDAIRWMQGDGENPFDDL